jgi:hypothetical protein
LVASSIGSCALFAVCEETDALASQAGNRHLHPAARQPRRRQLVIVCVMAKTERPAIQLDGGESNRLHAVWSGSGKRLIVSIAPRARWHEAKQVELTPEQVERLHFFLAERPD